MDSLKDLKKLILLCRQQGVQSVRFNGIELHLGDMPQTYKATRKAMPELQMPIAPGGITDQTRIMTDELTEEQMLFYSAGNEQQS